jgi:hypothetical protein
VTVASPGREVLRLRGGGVDLRSALGARSADGVRSGRLDHSHGWVTRLLTDDSVFGVVEFQSVPGVGELR